MKFRSATLIGVVALLAVSACSSDDDGAATGSGTGTEPGSTEPVVSTPDSSPETDEGAYPVTIDTKFGPVTIEEYPQRIVALGWGDAETALALDAQPVGASDWLEFGGDGVGPWAADLYDNPPEIIGTLDPSYEAIAALQPDIIFDVRSSGDEDRYALLSQIAPTVGVPEGGDSYLTSQEQQVTMIAAALGVPDEGAQLLADVEESFAGAREEHPDWDGLTVTAATRTSEGWGAYIEGGGRVEFMEALGFVQSPTIAALPVSPNGFSVDISEEQLDLLDADLIVAFPIYIETAAMTEDPLFQAIPAVADGRAVVIDGDLAAAYSLNTVLATEYALAELVPLIAEAVGG